MKLYKGGKLVDLSLSADPTTGYSDVFYVSDADAASLHLVVEETSGTFAVTVTLWATNKPNPDESNDTDWVDVSSVYTMPTVSGDGKFLVALPADGQDYLHAAAYRFKFVRTTGAGNLDAWLCIKDKV